MTDIRKLTTDYVAAFGARDLDAVGFFFAEEFELTDPEVTALTPKDDVLKYIKGLFDTHETLNFNSHNILVDGNTSVIHFTLTLGTHIFDGVDIITWKSYKMIRMKAYLAPR
jgi:ketosteroid isomerase-like protein